MENSGLVELLHSLLGEQTGENTESGFKKGRIQYYLGQREEGWRGEQM